MHRDLRLAFAHTTVVWTEEALDEIAFLESQRVHATAKILDFARADWKTNHRSLAFRYECVCVNL